MSFTSSLSINNISSTALVNGTKSGCDSSNREIELSDKDEAVEREVKEEEDE